MARQILFILGISQDFNKLNSAETHKSAGKFKISGYFFLTKEIFALKIIL